MELKQKLINFHEKISEKIYFKHQSKEMYISMNDLSKAVILGAEIDGMIECRDELVHEFFEDVFEKEFKRVIESGE